MSETTHRQELINRIEEVKRLKREEISHLTKCELDGELRFLASELCKLDYDNG